MDTIKVLLPNAKIVGDHFHFKSAIQSGFDKALAGILERELSDYRAKLRRQYKKKYPLETDEWVTHKVSARVENRRTELNKSSYILCKHPNKLKGNERVWLKPILRDHPTLREVWNTKNSGLDIFPEKPKMEKAKRSRAAVLAQRATLVMTEEDAKRRLKNWAESVDEAFRGYFKTPLNLIKNWNAELIRIGTTIYTNADTESKNHFLRLLAANSRGLEYEMLRARLLYAEDHGRNDRWPICFDNKESRLTAPRVFYLAGKEIVRIHPSNYIFSRAMTV
jgi:hypothetical protein